MRPYGGRQVNRRRVATYNIGDGGGERAGAQMEMLAELGTDLLLVSEAMGAAWAEGGELRREFEARLGMWSRGRLEPGDGDGAGRHSLIFGRHGVFHPGRYKPLGTRPPNWRGSGYLEVTTDGYPHTITVQADHGHTTDPATRLSEARHTGRCSIDLDPGPAIKAGDYNSVYGRPNGWGHLGEDDIAPDLTKIPQPMLPYHVLLDSSGDPCVDDDGCLVWDRRPAKALALAGFRDAVAQLCAPEDRPLTGGRGAHDAPRRPDRVNLRALTPVACGTCHAPDLSDHDLVYVDIDLDNAA